MTQTPAVTVVIPAYNRAEAIGPAIASVLRQTWGDFELVVVDDGSTDGTRAAVEAVADPRLRLVANPRNTGAAGARNTGIAVARAPWIAFQDSDDEWLPRKLEKQMARLLAPGAAFVAAYCGLLTLGRLHEDARKDGQGDGQGNGQGNGEPPERLALRYMPRPAIRPAEGDITEPLLYENLISTQTLVARAEVLRAIGGFDADLPAIEDWDLALRLAAAGPVALVDEPLVHQWFSPNSLTRDRDRQLTARLLILEKNRALFARRPATLARQHQIIANLLRARGELAAARRHIARACRADPANPRIWARAAEILARSLRPGGGLAGGTADRAPDRRPGHG